MRPIAVLAAAICLPVFGLANSTAPANADSVGQLNASINRVAQQWFDAQSSVQRLDMDISEHAQRIRDLSVRAKKVMTIARERAVVLYTGHGDNVTALLDSSNALDSARRVQFIERANDKSQQTFEALTELTSQLRHERGELVRQRDEKAQALSTLSQTRATLDSELQSARAAAAQRAAIVATRTRKANAVSATPATIRHDPSNSAAPVQPAPAVVVVPAPPSNRGVFPMHNHPFLVCTRSRESNGIYTVVSGDGRYYGAYQFARETWDVTAIHAGRSDLVGVLPNTASEYDQDQLAWSLYLWQGNTPWGGRC
jgi:peptidoglycan hydrolase CwlO-like protein